MANLTEEYTEIERSKTSDNTRKGDGFYGFLRPRSARNHYRPICQPAPETPQRSRAANAAASQSSSNAGRFLPRIP